jgi:hypothetical protein
MTLTRDFKETIVARLSMLGLPFSESMRCRLLAGLPVATASPSEPTVALTRSRRNQASCPRLAFQEQGRRLVEQCPGKGQIALHSIRGLYASDRLGSSAKPPETGKRP